MRAHSEVPHFRAAITTLEPASVPVTAVVRPRAVQAVFSVLAACRRSPYAMLFEALVRGGRTELATLLNAATGFRHGCATYLLNRRLLPAANMEVSQ